VTQEYLTRHYAEVERKTRESDSSSKSGAALPYTTSGHTILKKSSTDPTSNRSAESTVMKRTTFCDVVTVVDSDDGEVREERLHEVDDDDDVDVEEVSPSQNTGFFLSPTDTDSAPVDELDGGPIIPPDSCSAVQNDDVFMGDDGLSMNVNSVAYVFSTAASPQSDGSEPNSRDEAATKSSASLRTTKHVKLVDLMAQIRADDGGERS